MLIKAVQVATRVLVAGQEYSERDGAAIAGL
jgi:hypothetical protein